MWTIGYQVVINMDIRLKKTIFSEKKKLLGNVKRCIKTDDMTYRELEKHTSVSKSHINYIVLDRRHVCIDVLIALADHYDIPYNFTNRSKSSSPKKRGST